MSAFLIVFALLFCIVSGVVLIEMVRVLHRSVHPSVWLFFASFASMSAVLYLIVIPLRISIVLFIITSIIAVLGVWYTSRKEKQQQQ